MQTSFVIAQLSQSLLLEEKVAGFCLTDEVMGARHPQNKQPAGHLSFTFFLNILYHIQPFMRQKIDILQIHSCKPAKSMI